MKIRVETPIATLSADLTKEQVTDILGLALDYAVGLDSNSLSEPMIPESIVETPPVPAEPVKVVTHSIQDCPKNEYKGFLYLKCEECGKLKGFMPKTPIHKYRCDCGHITYLKDMKAMRVSCKCGAKFKYTTNATDSVVSIDCYNCGSPVDLEYHERKHEYLTIEEGMN